MPNKHAPTRKHINRSSLVRAKHARRHYDASFRVGILPGAKDGASDPDVGAPEFDCMHVVTRHAHANLHVVVLL